MTALDHCCRASGARSSSSVPADNAGALVVASTLALFSDLDCLALSVVYPPPRDPALPAFDQTILEALKGVLRRSERTITSIDVPLTVSSTKAVLACCTSCCGLTAVNIVVHDQSAWSWDDETEALVVAFLRAHPQLRSFVLPWDLGMYDDVERFARILAAWLTYCPHLPFDSGNMLFAPSNLEALLRLLAPLGRTFPAISELWIMDNEEDNSQSCRELLPQLIGLFPAVRAFYYCASPGLSDAEWLTIEAGWPHLRRIYESAALPKSLFRGVPALCSRLEYFEPVDESLPLAAVAELAPRLPNLRELDVCYADERADDSLLEHDCGRGGRGDDWELKKGDRLLAWQAAQALACAPVLQRLETNDK